MLRRALVVIPALLLAAPALGQNVPPSNSLPLSEVIARIEKTQPVRAFLEVEWDDDGYWDVQFVNRDSNRRSTMRVDPLSGEKWSRRGR